MSYARAQHERQKADQWSASGNGLSWTRNWTSSDRVLRSRNRIQDCLKSLQRTFLREVYGAHADSVSRGLKERPEDLEAGDVILVANPEVNRLETWLIAADHTCGSGSRKPDGNGTGAAPRSRSAWNPSASRRTSSPAFGMSGSSFFAPTCHATGRSSPQAVKGVSRLGGGTGQQMKGVSHPLIQGRPVPYIETPTAPRATTEEKRH